MIESSSSPTPNYKTYLELFQESQDPYDIWQDNNSPRQIFQ